MGLAARLLVLVLRLSVTHSGATGFDWGPTTESACRSARLLPGPNPTANDNAVFAAAAALATLDGDLVLGPEERQPEGWLTEGIPTRYVSETNEMGRRQSRDRVGEVHRLRT